MEIKTLTLNGKELPASIQGGLGGLFKVIGDSIGFSMEPKAARVNCTKIKISSNMFDKMADALKAGYFEEHGTLSADEKKLSYSVNLSLAMSGPSVEKTLPEDTIIVGMDAFYYERESERHETPSYKQENGLYLSQKEFNSVYQLVKLGYQREAIINTLFTLPAFTDRLGFEPSQGFLDMLEDSIGLTLLDEMSDELDDLITDGTDWTNDTVCVIEDNMRDLIENFSYEIYKRDWVEARETYEGTYDSLKKDYQASSETSFDDWLADKLDGEIGHYVCKNEFLYNEFQDEEIMETYLGKYPEIFELYKEIQKEA